MHYRRCLIGLAIVLAACSSRHGAEAQAGPPFELAVHPESGLAVVPLTVQRGTRVLRFRVEVAGSNAEQAKGLMFRQKMGADEGMIFPSDPPREGVAFWMKNTVIPLDIIFIGADHRDYSPETETGYTTNDSVVGSRTPIPLGLLQYAQDQTEDDRSFLPIDKFVTGKMDGLVDGRYGPFAVAARLRDASGEADKAIAAMPMLTGRAADEWRLLRTDLAAAARLSRAADSNP